VKSLTYDAVIIAESGVDGLTGILPDRLTVEEMPASIQVVTDYVKNRGILSTPVPGDGMRTWWSAPKLNGIYLYGFLNKNGFKSLLINKYYPERQKADRAIREGAKCVVISTTFVRSRDALAAMVRDIREACPDAFIVAGGPFVYLSYLVKERNGEPGYLREEARDDYLFFNGSDPEIDLYVVSLLGEEILCEVLRRRSKGLDLEGIPNTAVIRDGRYIFGTRDDDVSLASEAEIDWQSLPDAFFRSGVMPIQASKGCPHRCAFCSFVKDRRLIYVKPIERLMDELRAVAGRGIRFVWFVDDNFRLGKQDMDDFCRRLVMEKLDIRWMTMIRAASLKNMDVELMKEAGCIEVQMGLESADPKVLSNMNKQADPEVYREVVERLLGHGINCSCYFIFGFPGETDQSALRTRDFIKSLEHPEADGCLTWSLFPFCLYPMSPIYERDMRQKYGLTGHLRKWRHAAMDSERAMEHVKEAFMELDNSSPVYRGDNLDMLYSLTPFERKRFLVGRHRISKAAMERTPDSSELLGAFSGIIPDNPPWSSNRSSFPLRRD